MKIIQSFWSKPYLIYKNGGWKDKIYLYMSCALSCLRLSEYYPVELITDKRGERIFIDMLKLPFTTTKVILDNIKYPPYLWAAGKIISYTVEDEPFIHVDNDVFIWHPFPDNIISAELVGQNLEINYPFNIESYNDIKEKLDYIPNLILSYEKYNYGMIEVNAGILGGNDINFLHEYAKEAITFIEKNLGALKTLDFPNNFNMIFEQYLFYCLVKHKNIDLTCYFDKTKYDGYKGFANFFEVPRFKTYIHTLASYKSNPSICEQMAHRLWYEYPEVFYRIQQLVNDDII